MNETEPIPYQLTFSGVVPPEKAGELVHTLTRCGVTERNVPQRNTTKALHALGRLGSNQRVELQIGELRLATPSNETPKSPAVTILSRNEYLEIGVRQTHSFNGANDSWRVLAKGLQDRSKGINPEFPVNFRYYPPHTQFGTWSGGQVDGLEVESLKKLTDQYESTAELEGERLVATALAGPTAKPKHFEVWRGVVNEVLGSVDIPHTIQ